MNRWSRRDALGVGAGLLVALAALAAPPAAAAGLSDAVRDALAGPGRVILLRHAQTVPGVGDPAGYALDDCASQRNLNALGRTQSQRFGAALAAAGVQIERALSSRWCRCVDTARLALDAAGQPAAPVEIFEPLNNLWDDASGEAAAVAAIRREIAAWRGDGPLLMVSHGVTIRPTVGRSVGQGGFFVVRSDGAGGLEILAEGRL